MDLFNKVLDKNGTIISSFGLLDEAFPGNFPARNRIISGLSRGCLVVQAAKKSGALITAKFALDQGREVFAIPGNINEELSEGCNSLIKQGAKLVTNSNDILQELIYY
jgi:DNA processing protein